METSERSESVGGAERLVLMDGLRGLALLGIFLVNIAGMAAPSMAYGPYALWDGPISSLILIVRYFCADGAFVFLFSVLFGAGFSVMMGPFGSRSEGIGLWAYYRRLLLLGILGYLHLKWLWWGDILLTYAIAGSVLPFFLRCSDWGLLKWAGALVSVPTLLFLVLFGSLFSDPDDYADWMASYDTEIAEWTEYLVEGYQLGDFQEVMEVRAEEFAYSASGLWDILPMSLGYMLFGVWLMRQDRFRLSEVNDAFMRKLLMVVAVPALIGRLLYTVGIYSDNSWGELALFYLGYLIGGPALGCVYFCGMYWLFRRGMASGMGDGLCSAGRMALSHYLLQSVFACWLFHGYGLGLYAQVAPPMQVVIVFGFFAFQVLISQVWLSRYRQGPLEWGLRRWTYL